MIETSIAESGREIIMDLLLIDLKEVFPEWKDKFIRYHYEDICRHQILVEAEEEHIEVMREFVKIWMKGFDGCRNYLLDATLSL